MLKMVGCVVWKCCIAPRIRTPPIVGSCFEETCAERKRCPLKDVENTRRIRRFMSNTIFSRRRERVGRASEVTHGTKQKGAMARRKALDTQTSRSKSLLIYLAHTLPDGELARLFPSEERVRISSSRYLHYAVSVYVGGKNIPTCLRHLS